jgi:hypothetical protein
MTAGLLSWLMLVPAFSLEPMVPAETLNNWLTFLASDEMKGRDNGSPEIEKAAQWLAEKYKELGLQPVPGQESFFQEYTVISRIDGSDIPAKNVIGYLRGSDPKLADEYIVLSAHYDQVGVDESLEGDQILNGADDNASGVVTMLGIARTLQKLREQGKTMGRSLLVTAWSGEEMGLQGSRHYAKNPFLPVDKMAVNLNFELVGHTTASGKNTFWMTGAKFSNLHEAVGTHATANGWSLVDNPFPDMNLFFRSDNLAFAMLEVDRQARTAVGIPVDTFSTWGGEDHYHQVHDEPDKVDYDNLAAFVRLFTEITLDLSRSDSVPAWQENDAFAFSRPQ